MSRVIPFAGFDPEEQPLVPLPKRKDTCRRGHPFTQANTKSVTSQGKTFRRCRLCQSENNRRRYWADPARREKKKAGAKKYWHEVRKHKK